MWQSRFVTVLVSTIVFEDAKAFEKARKDDIGFIVGYGPRSGSAGLACLRIQQ